MIHNKDGGTSVGFSSDFILSGHEFLPQGENTNTTTLIDFKIKENLEQINIQQWEDIWNEFIKSLPKVRMFNPPFVHFPQWLKENYLPPEKK